MTELPEVRIPARLGPYTLGEILGQGGMGVVHRAHDTRLDRDVALKVMLNSEEDVDLSRKRFLREVKAQAAISHPNIVKILDVGEQSGYLYFAMELLTGRTLKEQVKREGALPQDRVISIGIAIAKALVELHARGCVHRDIKPANVFLRDDGQTVLMDLGLVRIADATIITRVGDIVGTPRYLPPECMKGAPSDALCDIYQLGLILYEAATGRPAFQGSDLKTIAPKVLSGAVGAPSAVNPAIGVPLDSVILGCLSRDRTTRTPDAASVANALECVRASPRGTSGRQVKERIVTEDSAPAAQRRTPAQAATTSAPSPAPMPVTDDGERAARGKTLRRTGLIAVVGLTSIAGAILAVVLTGKSGPALGRAGPASASATGPLAPARASQSSDAPRMFSQWKQFVSLLPRLDAGGEVARRTVATLRTQSAVDLGPLPQSWAHWIRLGRWLQEPVGPCPDRADPRAEARSRADTFLAEVVDEQLRSISHQLRSDGVAIALNLLMQSPWDGRLWLLVGRLLERDGEPREGLAAYRVGLSLVGKKPFETRSPWPWEGLARALWTTPGRSLIGEFTGYVTRDIDQDIVWNGLSRSIMEPGVSVTEVDRVLEQSVAHGIGGGYAVAYLGDSVESAGDPARRDPDRAESIWLDGLKKYPGTRELDERLARFYLNRGDAQPARRYLATLPDRDDWTVLMATLEGAPFKSVARSAIATEGSASGEGLVLGALRLIEAGAVPEATGRMLDMPELQGAGGLAAPTIFELMAAGCTDHRIVNLGESWLLGGTFSLTRWSWAAGIFTTPTGVRCLERLLAQWRAAHPSEPSVDLVEALWNCRRGRPREALAKLEAVAARVPMHAWPSALVAEILSRPVWKSAMGAPEDAQSARRARQLDGPPPLKDPVVRAYWTSLVAGNYDQAAGIARRLFRRDPREPLWGLAQIWDAVRRKDLVAQGEWSKRLSVAYRMHHLGLWPLREIARVTQAGVHR